MLCLMLISRRMVLASAIGLTACAAGPTNQTLHAFGDSITEGFVATGLNGYAPRLAKRLGWSLDNAAIRGTTINGQLAQVLKRDIGRDSVSVCLFGANNRQLLGGGEIVQRDFRDALRVVLGHLTKGRVYIGTTLPFGDEFKLTHPDFQAEYTFIIRQEAVRAGAIIVESGAAIDPVLHLPDGLHPNDIGHDAIADVFYRAILASRWKLFAPAMG